MPYAIRRVGTYYCVYNEDTGKKYSEHSTHENAKKQLALLQGLEHGTIKKPNVPISSTRRYRGT